MENYKESLKYLKNCVYWLEDYHTDPRVIIESFGWARKHLNDMEQQFNNYVKENYTLTKKVKPKSKPTKP